MTASRAAALEARVGGAVSAGQSVASSASHSVMEHWGSSGGSSSMALPCFVVVGCAALCSFCKGDRFQQLQQMV